MEDEGSFPNQSAEQQSNAAASSETEPNFKLYTTLLL